MALIENREFARRFQTAIEALANGYRPDTDARDALGTRHLRFLLLAPFAPVPPPGAHRHPRAEQQDNDHKRDVNARAQGLTTTAVPTGLFVRPACVY
jgi:hypothetical protein